MTTEQFDDGSALNRRLSVTAPALDAAERTLARLEVTLAPSGDDFDRRVEQTTDDLAKAVPPDRAVSLRTLREQAEAAELARHVEAAVSYSAEAERDVERARAALLAHEREAGRPVMPSLHPPEGHTHDRTLVETLRVRNLLELQERRAQLTGSTIDELVAAIESARATNDRQTEFIADQLVRRALDGYVPDVEALKASGLSPVAAIARLHQREAEKAAYEARLATVAQARISAAERAKLDDLRARLDYITDKFERPFGGLKSLTLTAKRTKHVTVNRKRVHVEPTPIAAT